MRRYVAHRPARGLVFKATFARLSRRSSRARWGTVRTPARSRAMRIIDSRLCLIVAGAALAAGSAFAQTPSPAPKNTPDAKSTAPGQSLSKELNQSNGVIHPKEVDPGIQKPAPRTGRSERGAAARDFRRRSRSAAKISAAFMSDFWRRGRNWRVLYRRNRVTRARRPQEYYHAGNFLKRPGGSARKYHATAPSDVRADVGLAAKCHSWHIDETQMAFRVGAESAFFAGSGRDGWIVLCSSERSGS